jgi:hypothetical protein
MSILVGSWKVSFSEGLDQDLGGHTFFDDKIQLWSLNWLVLLYHKGDPVIGRRVHDTVISPGSSLHIKDNFLRLWIPLWSPRYILLLQLKLFLMACLPFGCDHGNFIIPHTKI